MIFSAEQSLITLPQLESEKESFQPHRGSRVGKKDLYVQVSGGQVLVAYDCYCGWYIVQITVDPNHSPLDAAALATLLCKQPFKKMSVVPLLIVTVPWRFSRMRKIVYTDSHRDLDKLRQFAVALPLYDKNGAPAVHSAAAVAVVAPMDEDHSAPSVIPTAPPSPRPAAVKRVRENEYVSRARLASPHTYRGRVTRSQKK